MVISDYKVGKIFLKVESKYAVTSSGALCVKTPGILLTLMWPVDNLVSLQ